MVVNTGEPEALWNSFRFASAARSRGHRVSVFLLGPAVELERGKDGLFEVGRLLERFVETGGEVFTCGTRLRIRQRDATELCPVSTMDDLVRLTEEADRTVVFG